MRQKTIIVIAISKRLGRCPDTTVSEAIQAQVKDKHYYAPIILLLFTARFLASFTAASSIGH